MANLKDKVNSKADFVLSETHTFEESFTLRGNVKCWIEEDGIKTLHHEKSNLIVNGARKALAHLIGQATSTYKIDLFKLGTGGHLPDDILTPVSPTITDTGLEAMAFSKAIDHSADAYLPTPPAETSIKFTIVVEKYEGNGSGIVAYTEAGLFCASGVLFARETFPAIVKNSSRRVSFEWSILF